MFEAESETTPFRPYPHRNNGYAELPHVSGINNQSGIDPNPGYSQYLEY